MLQCKNKGKRCLRLVKAGRIKKEIDTGKKRRKGKMSYCQPPEMGSRVGTGLTGLNPQRKLRCRSRIAATKKIEEIGET